jgi:hypothetical protein
MEFGDFGTWPSASNTGKTIRNLRASQNAVDTYGKQCNKPCAVNETKATFWQFQGAVMTNEIS